MLVGICALPMQTKAACFGYTIDCGGGYIEGGVICGSSIEAMVDRLMEVASDICG